MERGTELDLEGRSDHARRLRMLARVLGRSRSPAVILGELGVGKSRFARLVHELSEHSPGVFRRVSCQVEGLDLTSVWNDMSSGGTVVFEHIDEAPPVIQRGIAQALAGRLCEGGRIRVLATSRRDLAVEVLEGRVTPDLYFRLRVQAVEIPPLRDRKEDIPVLARSILDEHVRARGGHPPDLTSDALDAAASYSWPGNVRQLKNELLRCASRAQSAIGSKILTEGLDTRLPVQSVHAPAAGRSLDARVAAFERQVIEDALGASGGNRERAASILGITRRTLQRKIAAARSAGLPIREPGAVPRDRGFQPPNERGNSELDGGSAAGVGT